MASLTSRLLGLLVIVALGGAEIRAAAQAAQEPWTHLLGAVGLSRERCRFDLLDMAQYGGGAYRLPAFVAVHQDPLRIPAYARIARNAIKASSQRLGGLASYAAGRTDDGTRLDLLGDPLADDKAASEKPGALLAALKAVWTARGTALPKAGAARIAAQLKTAPAPIARLAALLIRVELRALRWRTRALQPIPHPDAERVLKSLMAPPSDRDDFTAEIERVQAGIDQKRMLVGGELLAFALDAAAAAAANCVRAAPFRVDIETPIGWVAIRGGANDTYPADRPYLLILDTGGSDTYRAGGATRDLDNPVSLLIDLAGNDRYIAPDLDKGVAACADRKKAERTPAFGAGLLGYGMVLDVGGNDVYRAMGRCQGSGSFGVGILADLSGDDLYDCHTSGQGAAYYGVGILSDRAGTDEYRCFTTSQGYAFTRGCGLLADYGDGADLYDANDTVIDFPSPQSADHNASLSQGFGFGRRADYTDGHSQAGGIGILFDQAGANRFVCGVFGQGAGYWYGLGMLLSGAGDDTYTGQWYVQGSAAHFAVGILDDPGGSDSYRAPMNMAQGAGHDFSVGFLIDRAGNDRYEAPNLSLGGGNANGMGFFWDKRGDDVYIAGGGATMGRATVDASAAGSLRGRNLTLGVFLDTGGRDTYPETLTGTGENRLWTMDGMRDAPRPMSRGVGLDTEADVTDEIA